MTKENRGERPADPESNDAGYLDRSPTEGIGDRWVSSDAENRAGGVFSEAGAGPTGSSDWYLNLSRELEDLAGTFRDEDPKLPGRFGDFEILGEAGRGGMGVVFEARQISLDRRVALKVLPPSLLNTPDAVERFRREAQAAAKLDHNNIVSVFATGVEGGSPFYTMEFAVGETLDHVLRRLSNEAGQGSAPRPTTSTCFETRNDPRKATPPSPVSSDTVRATRSPRSYFLEVAETFAGAAEGLQHAHANGVLHRDIKPSNLILDGTGRLRLLDFGLARIEGMPTLTRETQRLGTPVYMSPEQVSDPPGPIDTRTDIYGLGATLYEVLTWQVPFGGRSVREVFERITQADPTPPRRLNPQIPRGLETIVLKCLHKNPGERFGTAEALAQDLRRFVRGDPIEARPQSWYEKTTRRAWRIRWRLVQAVGALTLISTLAALLFIYWARDLRERREKYDDMREVASINIVKKRLLSPTVNHGDISIPLVAGNTSAAIPSRETDGSSQLFAAGLRLVEAGPEVVADERDPIESAIDDMRKAILLFPDEPDAYYQLAQALFVQGRVERAKERLGDALSRDAKFLPALSLQAAILRLEGSAEAEEARAELLRMARESERFPEPWIVAHQAVLDGRWREAAVAFDDLLSSNSESLADGAIEVETLLGRGVVRLKTGDFGDAASAFELAAEKITSQPLQPRLLQGKALYLGDNARRATKVFEGIWEGSKRGDFKASPDEVARLVAETYRELGDFEQALKWSQSASDGRFLEAEFLSRLRRFDEARALCEEARNQSPSDPKPRFCLGVCLQLEDKLSDAETEFRAVIDLNPLHEAAHYNLGMVLSRQERWKEAAEAYRKAIEIDPQNAAAHVNLGTLHDRQGEQEKARIAYEHAVDAAPELALARYNLAWLYHRERRFGEAVPHYRAALSHGLDDAVVHSNLGACLYFRRRLDEMIEQYRAALEKAPEYPTLWLDLGKALSFNKYEAEQFAKAPEERLNATLTEGIEKLHEAIRLAPDHADSRYYLGRALERRDDIRGAITAYEKAVELDPTYVLPHNRLAGLLLQRELPDGETLEKTILRLENAQRLVDSSPKIGELLAKCRDAFLPRLASYASVDWFFDRSAGSRTFGAFRSSDPAAGLVEYLEARVLQREEKTSEAEVALRKVIALDAKHPEPFSRLAAVLEAQGKPGEAEKILRDALASPLSRHDKLWANWFRVAQVQLQRSPTEMLEQVQAIETELGKTAGGKLSPTAEDLRWLLERLSRGETLRINCGGKDYIRNGQSWSRDRFYRSGYRLYLDALDEPGVDIPDRALYQCERYFREEEKELPAYTIPLPKGDYRVTLHFNEGYSKAQHRFFDVLLEGKPVLDDFEPLQAGFGLPSKQAFEVSVKDGSLDIEFRREKDNPKISAIEIDRINP